MKIVLFCEQKYGINILLPLQEEASKTESHEVLWYIHEKNIPDFPLKETVKWTNSIQEIYDFHPDVLFVPCNIVPYYLPGAKVQIFHGYAAEKKDHWIIRRYFDLYFTQGPFFTQKFSALAKKYKDFKVVETGWTKQDWIYRHQHDYDEQKKKLLLQHNREKLVLYAPTFSPSMTSLPHLKESLRQLAREKNILLLLKFHPLTQQEWVEEYKKFATEEENVIWIDDHDISKYELMADLMISDTSSTVYEFLLLNKPVITYNTIAKDIYWLNIDQAEQLPSAFEQALQYNTIQYNTIQYNTIQYNTIQYNTDQYLTLRQWVIDNYDPHLDGKVCSRMFNEVQKYISLHGVPEKRKLNLWRKYTSIKKFGKIKKTRV